MCSVCSRSSSPPERSPEADADRYLNDDQCSRKYVRLFVFVLYTRYIFYLGTCTFVHGSLLLYNMHIYICVTTTVCVCRTMYVWPSQPGKVANPARGQQVVVRRLVTGSEDSGLHASEMATGLVGRRHD